MSEANQEKHAEIVRKLIEHENTLQNYRFTWFSTAQALLLAALGVSWDKAAFFACTVCIVGVITSLTTFAALRLCDLAYVQLSSWWNEHLRGYTGPPKQGFEGNYPWWLMPSKLLPWVFMFLWVALAVYRVVWYMPPPLNPRLNTANYNNSPPQTTQLSKLSKTVNFPDVQLHPHERIIAVKMIFQNASIRNIRNISPCWFASIDLDPPPNPAFNGNIEVGAAALGSTRELPEFEIDSYDRVAEPKAQKAIVTVTDYPGEGKERIIEVKLIKP